MVIRNRSSTGVYAGDGDLCMKTKRYSVQGMIIHVCADKMCMLYNTSNVCMCLSCKQTYMHMHARMHANSPRSEHFYMLLFDLLQWQPMGIPSF